MNLGRELNDFVGAFSGVTRTANSIQSMKDRRAARKAKAQQDPSNFPTVKQAYNDYTAQGGTASAIPADPSAGYGAATDTGGWGGTGGAYDTGYSGDDGQPDYGSLDGDAVADTYADGGRVELPPQQAVAPPDIYDEQGAPVQQATAPQQALPVASAPPRQALTDQTRTAAYDPEQDGPLPGQPAPVAAPAQAIPTQVSAGQATGAPTQLGGDQSYNPTAGGEGSSPNASHDLAAALAGGIKYATHVFHLGGQENTAVPVESPHTAGGQRALMTGVGAAPPALVQAIDQKVNQHPGVPQDESVWGIRRLEAIYRWYSMNGQKEKADKAAFELMQYSAGVAAKYGTQALGQLKAGDQRGAVQSIVQGHNVIPDGRKITLDGDTAIVKDVRTGDTVEQIQFKPQDIFNAALGLSNRSMYWGVIMNRAQSTLKGASNRSESQQNLDNARSKYYEERTRKSAATPIKGSGGRGGSGVSDGAKAIIDQINAIGGKAPTGAATPTTPSDDTDGPDADEDDTSGRGASPPNAGGEGGGEGPDPTNPAAFAAAPAQVAPQTTAPAEEPSVGDQANLKRADKILKLSPEEKALYQRHLTNMAKTQGGIQNGDKKSSLLATTVEVDGKTYVIPTVRDGKILPTKEAVDAAAAEGFDKYPSYPDEVTAKARYDKVHDFMERDMAADPDAVPDKVYARNGQSYEPEATAAAAKPFDKPKPDPNPYRALEAAAAKLSNKEGGAQVRALLKAKIAAYDKEAGGWDRERRAHDAAEVKRVATETREGRSAQKERMREAYDRKLGPDQVEQLRGHVAKAVDDAQAAISQRITDGKLPTGSLEKSIYQDKSMDKNTFHDAAISLATSNENMDANQAVRALENLTRAGDKPDERSYVVRGKDPLGNIIVTTDETGPLHIRPKTWQDITKVVRARNEAAMAAANTPPKKSPTAKAREASDKIGKDGPVFRLRTPFVGQR